MPAFTLDLRNWCQAPMVIREAPSARCTQALWMGGKPCTVCEKKLKAALAGRWGR